ncbi:MAG: hypothetical protein AAGF12_07075 [Myxococcota bacterium]
MSSWPEGPEKQSRTVRPGSWRELWAKAPAVSLPDAPKQAKARPPMRRRLVRWLTIGASSFGAVAGGLLAAFGAFRATGSSNVSNVFLMLFMVFGVIVLGSLAVIAHFGRVPQQVKPLGLIAVPVAAVTGLGMVLGLVGGTSWNHAVLDGYDREMNRVLFSPLASDASDRLRGPNIDQQAELNCEAASGMRIPIAGRGFIAELEPPMASTHPAQLRLDDTWRAESLGEVRWVVFARHYRLQDRWEWSGHLRTSDAEQIELVFYSYPDRNYLGQAIVEAVPPRRTKSPRAFYAIGLGELADAIGDVARADYCLPLDGSSY